MAYMTNREFAEHEYNRQKRNAYADALVKEVRRLREENTELKTENERLTAAYIELLKRCDDDICAVCKNRIECKGENCECFEQGKGGTIDGKEYPDWKWTCKDFDYGTCQMMDNTPCQGCFDNDYSSFDWVGLEVNNER